MEENSSIIKKVSVAVFSFCCPCSSQPSHRLPGVAGKEARQLSVSTGRVLGCAGSAGNVQFVVVLPGPA